MVDVFVEGTDALAVDDERVQLFSVVGRLYWFAPHPEALGARVNSGSDSKTRVPLIEYDSIHEETFASSILAGHCNDSNLTLDESEESPGFLGHQVFFCKQSANLYNLRWAGSK